MPKTLAVPTEMETKPFTASGRQLIAALTQQHNEAMGRALDAIGQDVGANPEAGWQPDVRRGVFVRPLLQDGDKP